MVSSDSELTSDSDSPWVAGVPAARKHRAGIATTTRDFEPSPQKSDMSCAIANDALLGVSKSHTEAVGMLPNSDSVASLRTGT
jgi:hypothetical protein